MVTCGSWMCTGNYLPSDFPRTNYSIEYYSPAVDPDTLALPWFSGGGSWRIAVATCNANGTTEISQSDAVATVLIDFGSVGSKTAPVGSSILIVEQDQTTGAVIGTAPITSQYRKISNVTNAGLVYEIAWIMPGVSWSSTPRLFFVYYDDATFSASASGKERSREKSFTVPRSGGTLATLNPAICSTGGFLIENEYISLYRCFNGRNGINSTAGNIVSGMYFSIGLGHKNGTFVTKTESIGSYPAVEVVNGPVFSQVTLRFGPGGGYPGKLVEQYRVFSQNKYIDCSFWIELVDGFTVTSNIWHSRSLTPAIVFDRIYGDTYGDRSIEQVWDTEMKYLIAYRNSDQYGFGWFDKNHIGVIRIAQTSSSIFDSYGYSTKDWLPNYSEYRYLWMPGNRDTTKNSFDFLSGLYYQGPTCRWSINCLKFPHFKSSCSTSSIPVELDTDCLPTPNYCLYNLQAYTLAQTDAPGLWSVSVTANVGVESASSSTTFNVFKPVHPRVYLSFDVINALKAEIASGGWAATAYYSLEKQCNNSLGKHPKTNPTVDDDLSGNRQYFDKAFEYMWQIITYPEYSGWRFYWGGTDLTISHFLMGISLGYDWLYQELTPLQRHEIRIRALVETEYVVPLYGPKDGQSSIGYYTANHGQIDNCAIGTSALVFNDEDVAYPTSFWQDYIDQYFGYTFDMLNADGGTHEGAAYWSYGLQYVVRYAEMRRFSNERNWFSESEYLKHTALYRLYLTLPDQVQLVDFGDCPYNGYSAGRTSLLKIASEYQDQIAQWVALHGMAPDYNYFCWDVLWYDGSVDDTAGPINANMPCYHHFNKTGITISRTNWFPNAQVLSFKSVRPIGGHEHPDANSWILDSGAKHLVVDHGYSYKKETKTHNTLIFDGQGQIGENSMWLPQPAKTDLYYEATILSFIPPYISGNQNFTGLQYSAVRTLIQVAEDFILLHDRVKFNSSATHTVDWRIHSYSTFTEVASYQFWTNASKYYLGTWLLHSSKSPSSYANSVDPTYFVPELINGKYNKDLEAIQVGYNLKSSATFMMDFLEFTSLHIVRAGITDFPVVSQMEGEGYTGVIISDDTGGQYNVVYSSDNNVSVSYMFASFYGDTLILVQNGSDFVSWGLLHTSEGELQFPGQMPMSYSSSSCSLDISLLDSTTTSLSVLAFHTHCDSNCLVSFDFTPEDDPECPVSGFSATVGSRRVNCASTPQDHFTCDVALPCEVQTIEFSWKCSSSESISGTKPTKPTSLLLSSLFLLALTLLNLQL
ncbi:hypothetical protein Pelo_10182 [Pelomyxa schiedti]|nr:hypothetical protein Pelo_10182 [Pelomyxa schiedti]